MIWKILKYSDEKKLFLYYSYYMVKLSHSNEVSFSDWVKAYILLSKALFLNSLIDDAINLLRILLDVFACIPIEDFKYLSEIYRINNISLTNMFVNYDSSLKFFSKYHVYQKSLGIFIMLENLRKKRNPREKYFFNSNNYKSLLCEKTPETNISENFINQLSSGVDSKRNSESNKNIFSSSIKYENIIKIKKDHNSDNCLINIKNNKNSNIIINSDAEYLENSLEHILKKQKVKNQKITEKKFLRIEMNNLENTDQSENENKFESKNLRNSATRFSEIKEDNINNIRKSFSISHNKNSVILNNNNSNNYTFTNLKDINCDNFKKLELYIDENINKAEIPKDSPCKIKNFFIF